MSTKFNSPSKAVLAGLMAGLLLAGPSAYAAKPAKDGREKASASETFRAPREGELVVSDSEFNHFLFPTPVLQVVFPAGAPLTGKPIYLDGNKQVLLQLRKGVDSSVQMVAEAEDGRVFKLHLLPRPVAGVTHKFPGAGAAVRRSTGGDTAASRSGASDERLGDVELLKLAVQGAVPESFERARLPAPTRFENFSAVPLQAWSDGSRQVMVLSLVAAPGKTAVVAPPQFYRDGVLAVLIDGDHVSDQKSPTLYVLEEVPNE